MEQEQEGYRSKLFNFKGMFDNAGRHTKSLSVESATALDPSPSEEDPVSSKCQGSKSLNDPDKAPKPRVNKEEIVAKEAKDKLVQGKTFCGFRFTPTLLSHD